MKNLTSAQTALVAEAKSQERKKLQTMHNLWSRLKVAKKLGGFSTRLLIISQLVLLSVWCAKTSLNNAGTSNGGDEFAYLDILIERCGDLCKVSGGRFKESLFFPERTVKVDCDTLYSDDVFISRGHNRREAPEEMPHRFRQAYTLGGKVPVRENYYNEQKYLKSRLVDFSSVWTQEMIEDWVKLATKGELQGTYGREETLHLQNALKHATGVYKGRALVIGSNRPWVEATLLSAGVSSIVTLEYGKIRSEHPAIKTMLPAQFKREFRTGALGFFDLIVSFSSVEHSGLGRYGDALNPWGDVLEIARAHCICKPSGSLVLAVMGDGSRDALEFNAHRIYGHARWPYLASNWKQVYQEPSGVQRVHVFMKKPASGV